MDRRAVHTAVACPKRCGRPVWRSTPGGIGSWRRRENSVRFVGSRLREKARALVSGQFRATDVLLPRREQSLKFRFRVLEFRYDQGVAWREEVRCMVDDGSILVTGAAGQLGSVGRTVTGLLLDRGFPVRAMVRREDERRRPYEPPAPKWWSATSSNRVMFIASSAAAAGSLSSQEISGHCNVICQRSQRYLRGSHVEFLLRAEGESLCSRMNRRPMLRVPERCLLSIPSLSPLFMTGGARGCKSTPSRSPVLPLWGVPRFLF